MESAARKVEASPGVLPLTLQLEPAVKLTEEQFFELAVQNRDLRLERNAEGEVEIMLPTGGETGSRNSEINMQLRLWAKRDGTGVAFDSSTGFTLPNGALRSPDASWVALSRLESLMAEQRERFIPLCPDFVAELRSPTDELETLQRKMEEYVENGARLGWLVNPLQRRVHVYRSGERSQTLESPEKQSGEPVLSGFVLDLGEIRR